MPQFGKMVRSILREGESWRVVVNQNYTDVSSWEEAQQLCSRAQYAEASPFYYVRVCHPQDDFVGEYPLSVSEMVLYIDREWAEWRGVGGAIREPEDTWWGF